MPQRILLVDGQPLFRQGLWSLLSSHKEFVVVGEASDGEQAWDQANAHRPDLVLTDMALPDADASQVIAKIKRWLPSVKVVVLTESTLDQHVRKALRAGVDGYVLKGASLDELRMALRAAHEGRRYLSPDVSGLLVEEYLNPGRRGAVHSPLHALTQRELSILQLVAEGSSNRRAAESLSVSTKTIEKHRANMMRKLGLRNVGELMMAAVEMGVIERPGTVSRLVPARAAKG
jgi:DNA-binding NarL/FixJ family response regulator